MIQPVAQCVYGSCTDKTERVGEQPGLFLSSALLNRVSSSGIGFRIRKLSTAVQGSTNSFFIDSSHKLQKATTLTPTFE